MRTKNRRGVVQFPLSEAFSIGLEHVRKRLLRSMIIAASITLGISFVTHLNMTNIILNAYMKELGGTMEAYQFWLIIVSLFVCSIGLVNSNLIAIYERYREIGTMKCLGALDQHILKLFFIEAFLIGLIGGIAGFSIGMITATLASCIQLGFEVLQRMPLLTILLHFGLMTFFSVALSIVSTIYPTLKAAKLNPVEALRYHV